MCGKFEKVTRVVDSCILFFSVFKSGVKGYERLWLVIYVCGVKVVGLLWVAEKMLSQFGWG